VHATEQEKPWIVEVSPKLRAKAIRAGTVRRLPAAIRADWASATVAEGQPRGLESAAAEIHAQMPNWLEVEAAAVVLGRTCHSSAGVE
jgi:hypothetical protein